MEGFPRLSAQDVRQLLTEDFPDIHIETLRELPEPETWVWVINEKHVFRFPRVEVALRSARVR